MKRIFSTLILFLFSLSCFAQDGFTAIMPAVRPNNGLLIPDNAMTNPEKLILMDTFRMANIRFSLTLYDWPHAITAYNFWINNGKKVILNVNYECASLPCPWPTNMVDYSNKMTSLLNTLPVLPDLFAIENEEFNDNYHTGPISDYITELQTAAALIHARGKKVTNGGIGGANGSMDILVYRYLKATYGQATANLYGASAMLPFQVTAANNPGSNPALDAEADTVAMALTAYKDVCDYINFHDLYEPINPNVPDTTTALTPLVLKYRQEYVAAFTKKAFITNETGQKNLSPSLVNGMLQRYIDRNLFYVVWYDGDGTGGASAMALNEPTGLTVRYNGNVYRKFFGGDTVSTPVTPMQVIQAINMPTKSGAGSAVANISGYADYYQQDANGFAQQSVTFPTAGTYRFDVSAYSNLIGAIYSNMQIRVDGVAIANITVNSTTPKIFSVVSSITSGAHNIALALTNDGAGQNLKLNLGLLYITASSAPLPYVPSPIVQQNITPSTILNSNHFGSGHLRGFNLSANLGLSNADLTKMVSEGANLARFFVDADIVSGSFQIRAGVLTALDNYLNQAEANGWYIVPSVWLNPESTQAYWGTSGAAVQLRNSIIAIYQTLATRYKNRFGIAAYDSYNEPNGNTRIADYIDFITQTISAVRAIDPTHTFIVAHPQDMDYWNMSVPLPFTNLVYEIHEYKKHEITHQGVSGAGYDNRIPYPASSSDIGGQFDVRDVSLYIDPARQFASRYNTPFFCGEFSCIRWAPQWSADVYVNDVISLFETLKWTWVYHAWREAAEWDAETPASAYYNNCSFTLARPSGCTISTIRSTFRSDTSGAMVVLRSWFALNARTQTILRPDHIVICILENHAYSQIIGSASAPYINALATAAHSRLFTQSFAIEHPSQPNYLDFYSGRNQGITDDAVPSVFPFISPNLGAQLITNNFSYITYSEDLPSPGYNGASSSNYARKHNPAANWMGVTTTTRIPTTTNQPFTVFPTDFTQLPTVSIVVPNQNNDMHNGSDPARIVTGDTWVQNNMDAYIQWAKTHNSLFILTFDEDNDAAGNRIATIFSGQNVATGTTSTTINHYNVLRTLQDIYALPYIANTLTSSTISGIWITPP